MDPRLRGDDKNISMRGYKILTIINLAFFVSFLSILRVIVGFIQTPPGSVYLAVGHYYQDYFEYLQQTAQGMMGHWTVLNQFATDDPTQTILGWGQYLIIGKIVKIFHLSVVTGYWLAVFFLVFILSLSIFFIIRRLLPKLGFYYQLAAWLFCLFAAPFFKIVNEIGVNKIILYDFWYSPMSFFHRFGGIPHHLSTGIFTILILLISADIFDQLRKDVFSKIIYLKIIVATGLMVLLLTFAPLQVVNLISAIFFLGFTSIMFNNKSVKKIIFFLLFIILIIFPTAWLIKISHDGSGLFQRAIIWETLQEYHPKLLLIFLTTGPILIFASFGLRRYFKNVSNIRWLLLFYVCFSYLYFFTPLAGYLGTFNLRFLSPVAYILFAGLAILGIIEIGHWFEKRKQIPITFLTVLLLSYFIWITAVAFISFGPVDKTSYLPNPIYSGLKFLGNQPEKKAVLSSAYFGLMIPVFADKNVYIGRMIFTPDLEKKLVISDRFYQGEMNLKEAKKFVNNNQIGFIFLTFYDIYQPQSLEKYTFLKIIYDKENVKVYKVL